MNEIENQFNELIKEYPNRESFIKKLVLKEYNHHKNGLIKHDGDALYTDAIHAWIKLIEIHFPEIV